MDESIFQSLKAYLEKHKLFKDYVKKKLQYRLAHSMQDIKNQSYFISNLDKDIRIVTKINGQKEIENTLHKGDVLIVGTKGEQYVTPIHKFIKVYDINKTIATPTQEKRKAAKITPKVMKEVIRGKTKDIGKEYLKTGIQFKSPWGEIFTLYVGDYLMKDISNNDGYYRIEGSAFNDTYRRLKVKNNIKT